jgi:(p)ppGpp synthase/HD superfamily hydrolase
VAILHDIVEDTNISIPTIAKLFWAKIALSVELLTKKSALDFVDETIKSHKKMKERLENSTLINNNWLLCDRVKSILRKIKEKEEQKQEWDDKINLKSKKAYNAEEKLFLERSWLTLQETIDLPKLNFLEEKYKQARNTHYFSKYQDDTELMNQANAVVGKRWFTLSQEQIQEAANNSIIVKLADRHHNLNTLWNKEKISGVIKKVSETIDYLLSAPKGLCDRLQEMVIQDVLKIIWSLQKSSSEFSESEKEDYKNFMIKVQSKSDEIILFRDITTA